MSSATEEIILKKLARIEKLVENGQAKKSTWVKVSVIKDVTIWNTKEKLRVARDNGLVKFRSGEGVNEYLLESINPLFLKNK